MQIAIVGSGYVGLVAGACFADLGHQVILVDNDQAKLAALKAGEVPIHEKFLPELLKRHRGHNLTFSDDLAEGGARQPGHFHRRGHAADRAGRSRPLLRGIGGPQHLRGHQRLQGRRGEKYRPGLHQRLGAQDYFAQCRPAGFFRCRLQPGISARRHRGHRLSLSRSHRGGRRQRTLRRRAARDLRAADRRQLLPSARMRFPRPTGRRFLRR